jgi:uncharacterized protein (DUF58 family)
MLINHPDPRRIDVRQTMRDPFEQVHVRRFEERSAVAVTVLLDVSASMSFVGRTRKMALAVELVRVLAASARRTGDTFALYGCDRAVRPELSFPPSRSRVREQDMLARIAEFRPLHGGSSGLLEAAETIAARRGVVFVISDFFMDESEHDALFQALSAHDVIPIALSDSSEMSALPDWGLLALRDLETGRRRLVVMRPSLKTEWGRRSEARRTTLRSVAARYGREPIELKDAVDWERLGAALLCGA